MKQLDTFSMPYRVVTFSDQGWWFVLAVWLLSGCATPVSRLYDRAAQYEFSDEVVTGEHYSHAVFRSNVSAAVKTLHVYLEGDGRPWRFRYWRAKDPTPPDPLMMRLMRHDSVPAVYVGRPCYNGFAEQRGCHSGLWTSGRYSPAVINSMLAVINNEIRRTGAEKINLFGHSGGATLAVLLADRLQQTEVVVTLAGNFDVDAWTSLHGYAPLLGSVNPINTPALRTGIRQIHLFGALDANIPSALALPWLMRQHTVTALEIPNFGHGCCWEMIWSDVLLKLAEGPPYRWPTGYRTVVSAYETGS